MVIESMIKNELKFNSNYIQTDKNYNQAKQICSIYSYMYAYVIDLDTYLSDSAPLLFGFEPL